MTKQNNNTVIHNFIFKTNVTIIEDFYELKSNSEFKLKKQNKRILILAHSLTKRSSHT